MVIDNNPPLMQAAASLNGKNVDWLEKASDEQYRK
jgi:hypothetical protein